MSRDDYSDVEMMTPADICERIRVAWGVLDTFTLPHESRKILNYCMGLVMLMASEAPEVLVILSQDMTARLLAYRETKNDA